MRIAPKQNGDRFTRLGAFVNSRLDDLGLDVYEFRVYTHLLRRAGRNSTCTPSIKKIAGTCVTCPRKVQSVLKQLSEKGLIHREPRHRENGSPTSDLISILGIPPGASSAPGVVHAMHQPDAPGAYKENPIKESPIEVCSGERSSLSHKRSADELLKSEELPEPLCDLKKEFTENTLQAAWIQTRSYFAIFTWVRTVKNLREAFQAFAAVIQASQSFQHQATDYLAQYQVDPEQKEKLIRDSVLLAISTPYWDVIKHLQAQSKTFAKTTKSNRDFEEEAARHAAAQVNPVNGNLFSQLRKENRTRCRNLKHRNPCGKTSLTN